MSSIKVNGESTTVSSGPFRSDNSPSPKTPYGVTKFEGERRVIEVCEANSMDWVIVRAPLVCGPGAKGNLEHLIRWASRGFPVPFGAVWNRRSMVSVVDLASLLSECAMHEGRLNQVLLASDDRPVSTAELCRWIIDDLNSRSVVVPIPLWLLNMGFRAIRRRDLADKLLRSLEVDNSAAKNAVGWEPREGVRCSIRNMVVEHLKGASKR